MAKPHRTTSVQIGDLILPVQVFFERRNGSRVSIGRQAVLVRLPPPRSESTLRKQWRWVLSWLHDTYKKTPAHLIRLSNSHRSHESGDVISLFDQNYTIIVEEDKSLKNPSGRLIRDKIILRCPYSIPKLKSSPIISRLLAKKYQQHFHQKVSKINDQYFQRYIQAIRLKYNSSNWGSCSSNNIINLSTRLLLTPEIVQEYVIVHELSHLIEMNHSHRFWEVVSNVMPNYQVHEDWLNQQGIHLDF